MIVFNRKIDLSANACMLLCYYTFQRDYLTGFHKRKQARRRFGLAMQEIKDRKERLEERKEVRCMTCMVLHLYAYGCHSPLQYIILRSVRQVPDSPCAVLSCPGATAAQSSRSVEAVELPHIYASHHSRLTKQAIHYEYWPQVVAMSMSQSQGG